MDFPSALEWSLEILRCLEERGAAWPLLFGPAERGERGANSRVRFGDAPSLRFPFDCKTWNPWAIVSSTKPLV